MTKASRSIVIDVDPGFFYDLVCDFEKYPEFVKDMKDVRIDKQGDNEWTVTFFVNIIKKVEYTLNLKGDPGKSLMWNLAKKGFMKRNDGGWRINDLGNGQIEAFYDVEVDLGLLAPKSIINMLISTTFPAMLKSFKKRAESLK